MKKLNRLSLDWYVGLPALIVGLMLISARPRWVAPLLVISGGLILVIGCLGNRQRASGRPRS